MVGVEKEADLLPLFECLLPLFPKTDLAIHMIGNRISSDIPPTQRAMAIRSPSNDSTIFLSLTTSLYTAQHLDGTAFSLPADVPEEIAKSQNFGAGEPDVILALNAALVVHGEWAPFLQMVGKSGKKLLVTESMEQLCNSDVANLPRVGTKMSISIRLNPFRMPMQEFKKDVNLPGFSNGFIFGIN